jgi:hypothetical protein
VTDPQEPEAQTRHLPRDRSGDLLRQVLKRQAQQHPVPPEVQELEKQKQRELEGQQKWVRRKEARSRSLDDPSRGPDDPSRAPEDNER